jgi:hypothetical protein
MAENDNITTEQQSATDLGWHFVGNTLRDGSPVPANGVTLKHTDELIMCEAGLHYSRSAFDALQYAPGPVLCRVEMGGVIPYTGDKGCGSERTIIARHDVTNILRRFAKDQAKSVLHLWDAPQVVVDYLNSDTEELRDTARFASRLVAWDTARDASRLAAWDTARLAARDAARLAAWDAAWASSRAASWASSRKEFDARIAALDWSGK